MSAQPAPIEVFYSYAHQDQALCDELEKHLSILHRQGLISSWHDRKIPAGTDWAKDIDTHLETASLILLLVSSDFLASDYCYSVEMKRALEREKTKEALVIPILLRPVEWEGAPFAHLQALPTNGKAVTTWPNQDEAFLDIARGIRTASERFLFSSKRQIHQTMLLKSVSHVSGQPSPDPPITYIPFPRSVLFQERPGEFEQLEMKLFGEEIKQKQHCIGLIGAIGMGGIGKTQLAIELAYRYKHRFPGGVFWMPAAGKSLYEWQRQLAELAFHTGYLPPDDDVSHPENEARRARHLCRYLAQHADALLILDNVEDPYLILPLLLPFTREEPSCRLLYTSRSTAHPPGISLHHVEQLTEDAALRLLLETTRPLLLSAILSGHLDSEAEAAYTLCRSAGYLPLALVHLRGLLVRDRHASLAQLTQQIRQKGTLAVAQTLSLTFEWSWERVSDKQARHLFLLASLFAEAIPIPLWLLGLATGLGENADILEPLGSSCLQLQEASLIERLTAKQIRLHPLVREFGRQLVMGNSNEGKILREEAAERLAREFTKLSQLEERARQQGYWICLEQIRTVLEYLGWLGAVTQKEQVQQIERWLDQESHLLGNERWWPTALPSLFYQQLVNRSVEEGRPLQHAKKTAPWLYQVQPVGVENHSLLRVFSLHHGDVRSVAFSYDGQWILTSSEKTVYFWRAESGKLLNTFVAQERVWCAAFVPNGTQVLIGSSNGQISIWEAKSGKASQMVSLQGVEEIIPMAFSPNGQYLLTMPSWGKKSKKGKRYWKLHIWEVGSGRKLSTLEGHSYIVSEARFSPDNQYVLTGSWDHTARLWNVKDGQELKIFVDSDGHGVNSVAFSPNGQQVLTGSHDGRARLWDINSERIVAEWDQVSSIQHVAYSPDGRFVLTSSDHGTIRLWETEGKRGVRILEGHMLRVVCADFSFDGRYVLTGSWDGTARLWKTESKLEENTLQDYLSEIFCVAFSSDGQRVITGSDDGKVQLWDVTSNELLCNLTQYDCSIRFGGLHNSFVRCVCFSPDDRYLFTYANDKIAQLWDAKERNLLHTFDEMSLFNAKFSPDSQRLLTGDWNGTAQLWEVNNRVVLRTFEGHDGRIWSIAFSSDSQKVLIGSDENKAQLWEVETGKLLGTFEEHTGSVTSTAFSPDGRQVLTGDWDGTVRLWDVNDRRVLCKLEGHHGTVRYVTFSPDARFMIASDQRGWVFFWSNQSPNVGRLIGLYVAGRQIEDIYWINGEQMILAGTHGAGGRPNLYHLRWKG